MARVKTVRGTTERLLAIADIVESGDDRWKQSTWGGAASPEEAQKGHDCGTYACIAGWATALTPVNEKSLAGRSWVDAGVLALGLQDVPKDSEDDPYLPQWLFDADLGWRLERWNKRTKTYNDSTRRRRVAKVLRTLASVPEEKRDDSILPRLERILETGR